MRATVFLWEAAGSPAPTTTDGTPIPSRMVPVGARCTCCGNYATHALSDAISDHFTTVANDSRAWPHGGRWLCARCVWCARSLALRCAPFFATEQGFWFFGTWALRGLPASRPDALTTLLHPPAPPFVACFPLAGIEHGGEEALERTMLAPPEDAGKRAVIAWIRAEAERMLRALLVACPATVKPEEAKRRAMRALVTGTPPWASLADWETWHRVREVHSSAPWWRFAVWPLLKLQSKHVAIYARVSEARDRYWLQVDDAGGFLLDVELWRMCRTRAARLLVDLRGDGVGAREATEALRTLRQPLGSRMSGPAWRDAVAPLRAHHEATWWPLFVSLLPMPELVPRSRRA